MHLPVGKSFPWEGPPAPQPGAALPDPVLAASRAADAAGPSQLTRCYRTGSADFIGSESNLPPRPPIHVGKEPGKPRVDYK